MNNDSISREWLRTAITKMFGDSDIASSIDAIIDNAPTVEQRDNFDLGYIQGLEDGKKERKQGECKDCKNFKESLCENSPNGWCLIRRVTQEGVLETQVPKDYYCSWFEKGGAV